MKKTWPEGYPRKRWRGPLLCALGALLALIVLSGLVTWAGTAG